MVLLPSAAWRHFACVVTVCEQGTAVMIGLISPVLRDRTIAFITKVSAAGDCMIPLNSLTAMRTNEVAPNVTFKCSLLQSTCLLPVDLCHFGTLFLDFEVQIRKEFKQWKQVGML